MALVFTCQHCQAKITVHYLKPGEEAQCKICEKTTVVPDQAESVDLPKPVPPEATARLSEPAEVTAERISRMASIRTVKFVLDFVWYVGWVALAISVLVPGLMGHDSFIFHNRPNLELAAQIRWDDPPGMSANTGEKHDQVMLIGHDQVIVRVPEGSAAWSLRLNEAVASLMVLIGVFFLRRVFRAIAGGRPFARENSNNLRLVGIWIACSGPIWGTFKFFQAAHFISQIDLGEASVGVSLSWHPKFILAGLVIIAIAHLFELAARIQRENELTV